MASNWLFDTDMYLHARSNDPGLRAGVEALRTTHKPTAGARFSKLEIKHKLQEFILLKSKILDSGSLQEAGARITSTGGRASGWMYAALIHALGGVDAMLSDWPKVQRQLAVAVDGLIAAYWGEFDSSYDIVLDALQCTRASEAPTQKGAVWHAKIPKCTKENTSCAIVAVARKHVERLDRTEKEIGKLAEPTAELAKIAAVCRESQQGDFPWEGTKCRSVGDLLIGIEAKAARGLVSSNKKEHECLAEGLGYKHVHFDMAKARIK